MVDQQGLRDNLDRLDQQEGHREQRELLGQLVHKGQPEPLDLLAKRDRRDRRVELDLLGQQGSWARPDPQALWVQRAPLAQRAQRARLDK